VKPWDLETAQNTHAYIGNWNINTNHWLRNYVYLRVTPKGKKPGFRATLATFFTSAFWHGFYPGYYLTFVLGSFLQTVSKNARRLIRPFFLTADGQKPTGLKIYYDVFCWIVTQTAFAFAVAPFVVLTIGNSLKVWSGVYFYCIIGLGLCMGFLASPAKALVVKRLKAYQKPGLSRTDSRDNIQRAPTLGVPDDPERTIDEIVAEVKAEVQRRKKEGVEIPDVRELIREKLEELKLSQIKKVAQTKDADLKGFTEEATNIAQVQADEGKKEL
jgi:lysophospholipid acyltransferase